MKAGIIFVIWTVICTINAADNDCPIFTDITLETVSHVISDAGAILNFTRYDTSDMKFFVMTPTSYPNFVNPDGNAVNWSTSLGCDDKEVLFNCHGFREDGLHVWAVDLVRTFVSQYQGCAVAIDYEGASENLNYLTVVKENTQSVARAIADYASERVCRCGSECGKRLQLHGHSWGAHTCGIAGYILGQRDGALKPHRMIASDAAGPYFNALSVDDPSSHMSPESAGVVVNIKTSDIYGSSLKAWADQTQYIADCGSNQRQCGVKVNPLEKEMCDHKGSVFITKSTMHKDFPKVNVTKCTTCNKFLPILNDWLYCSDEKDYLGWQSNGKPGLFVIKKIPVCLNVTIDSDL